MGSAAASKIPPTQSSSLEKKEVPTIRRKDVTYGSFVCNVRNEKDEKIEPLSLLVEIESTIPVS